MYRIALLVLFTSIAHAAPTWPAKPIEITLDHPRGGHARTIQAELGGARHTMLFDTGGGVTAISPALARELGCTATGTSIGLRMTGERVEVPLCRDIEVRVGGLAIRTEAAVIDLGAMLGKQGPTVDGMISLATLDDLAVTLDLARERLWIESPRSLAARTKQATSVPFRRATGIGGGQLSPFAGVRTPKGTVWLEVDSGHGGTTFVSPNAASLLGAPDGGEAELALGKPSHLPLVVRKDLVLDGVLSAATLARTTWTFDLRGDALWVGALASIPAIPSRTSTVRPPNLDPIGTYEVALAIGGKPAPHVLRVQREGAKLRAEMRALGEDEVVRIDDVTLSGATLTLVLPMRTPTPLRITFEGLTGSGTWGDPAARGGTVTATKRS